MLFNSLEFAVFFPIVLAVAFLLRNHNLHKKLFLIAASMYFYMSWREIYVWLLVGSILFNYLLAKLVDRISRPQTRKQIIFWGVAANLLLLSIFKYTNFIIDNINSLLAWVNLNPLPSANIILPIGISFFTFQGICYIVDVYRRSIKPANLINTSLYISFFPQLIAGPIVRAQQILPQFDQKRSLQKDNMIVGGHRIFWGLIKKMVFADNLGIFVNQIFAQYAQYDWLTLLIAVYAFAFQIYFDFSGYSDIAIGSLKMLGYDIPENFNLPYIAANFSDFWRRWNISLSSWLSEYLYIPLGGNRKGGGRSYVNIMITMFLGGLWHGAKWTFVIWGVLHGSYLVAQKIAGKRIKLPDNAFVRLLKIFLTFQLVNLTWIFFRAENFSSAWHMLTAILTLKSGITAITFGVWLILFIGFILHWAQVRFSLYNRFISLPYYFKYIGYAIGIFLLFFNKSSLSTQFIYFQF